MVTYSTSGSKTVSLTITDGTSDTETKTDYITVTPTVGTPTAITISAGTEPTCQLTNGTTTTTYATTATNNTGFNWSLSNGSAGSIGAATGIMTWANGFSGTVNIQVTANGCNGPSSQVIRTVTVTPTVGTPTAITVSAGTEPTCQVINEITTTTYATTATNNTGFNWSLSDGSAGSIGASTGLMIWAYGFSGIVDIQVTANGCNGPSAQVIRTVTVIPTVGTPTAITISAGTEPTCQLTNGTTTTTYATTANNNTGFNWSLSNGSAGSIGATTGVMTWANGFSGTVNIQVTANGCNGPSDQVIRTVTVTPTVGTPTAITVSAGTEPTCQLTNGTTTTTYATTATNNTGFNWSLSNGSAGSIGATTGIMTWVNGFSGTVNIQVTANGCNGPSSKVIRTVTVTPTVGTPTAITVSAGTEPTCQLTNGTTTTTYATTATNNTGFNWSLSNGSAGSINASTGVMTWANGFSGTVNIQVTANGCNGPSSQVIRTVTITPTVGTPTAITVSAGTEPTCQLTNGTTTTTYATTATNNTGFNWSLSNGSAGSIGASTGVMTWANGFSGTVNIQVTANGCNGPSAQVIRTVIVNALPTTSVITGNTTPACNGSGYTYSVTLTTGSSYAWTVPAGATITAGATGPGNNQITVTFGSTNGDVTVTETNAASCVGTTRTLTISLAGCNLNADFTGTPLTICQGSMVTFTNTSTGTTGSTTYSWDFGAGATPATANTVGPHVVTYSTSGSKTVSLTITDGTSDTETKTDYITVTPTVGTPTAITISAGTEPTCQLTNGTTTTTYATTATNNTGFNWSLSNGSAGSIGATTGVMTWANGFSGTVNIQVTANGCNGPSSQVIRTVTVTPTVGTPTAITVSAGTEPTCQLTNGTTTTTYATTATNNTGFNWSLSNGSAGSIGASTGVMTWANGFSGTVNIQVTANGCNGPSSQVIRTVTITPTVGTPTAITVSAGIEPTCQLTNGTTTTTYATTATNNTGFNWSLSNGSAGSIGATTGVMTWANGFSGTVNIQVTANGCNGPSSQVIRTVIVNALPTTSVITGNTTPVCNGSGYTYSVTLTIGSSYAWTVPAGAIITAGATGPGNNQITVTFGSTNGDVTVTETNAASCVGTTRTLTISLAGCGLNADFTGTPLTICQGSTVTFTNTSTGTTGSTTYSWDFGAGATPATANTVGPHVVTYSTSGSKTVSLTITDGTSDTETKTDYITVTPTVGTPTAITISAGTEPTCQLTNGTTTTTYATTATNNTGFNWSLSNGSAGSIGATTGVMTWANGFSGTVNIQVTANGCNGPSSQVIRTVTVTPTVGTPTAITVSAGTEPTCQLTNGTTTTTYATTATNNTGFNWSLSNGSAGSINASTGVMTWANGFSGTVNIQVTANGCNGPSAQVIRTVTITPTVGTPTAITVSAGTEPTCQLTNGTTTTTYATTATNNTGFNWSLSNGSAGSIGATTGVMTWANGFSGTVNIQVTANGCNGPSSQVIRTVIVNALPTTSVITGNTTPVCNGSGYTYSVTLTIGSSYAWTVPAGAIITAGATGPGNNQITVTFGSTNGDVTVTETDAASCVGTTRTLTISLAGCGLNADFTGTPLTICQGSTVTFTNTSTGTTGSTTYSWDFGAGATPATANTVGPHVVTYSTSGSKTVSLTITDGTSDTETKTDYITVTPTVGTPTAITISAGTEPTCQLTNGTTTTTYATTATNNTGFNWSLSNGSAGSIGATTGVMTWANGFSGTVNIQVTANGCNGPSSQVIRTVTITPTVGTPTAITVSAGTEPTCQLTNGTTTTTYATTATNNTGFNWSLSNGSAGSIGATTGVMTWANGFSGTVNIQVTANGCNGPSSQVIRTVTITPTVGTPTAITVSAGTEPTCQLTNGTTTTTYATTATNNTGFNWSLSNGSAGSIGASTGVMTWANGFSGTVNIQVTANGCNGPSSQVIRTVIVNALPTTSVITGNTTPACNGSGYTYSVTLTTGSSYAWTVPAGAIITAGATGPGNNQITVTFGSTNGDVTVTETNAASCVGSTKTLTINLAGCGLNADFTGTPLTICQGSTVTFTNTSTGTTGSTTYSWDFGAGATPATANTVGPHVVTYSTSGSKTVSLTITDGSSDTETKTNYITVTPTVGTPTAITILAGTEPTCQLTNGTTTTTYATTATNNTGFNWSLSNGSAGSIGATTGIMTWANGFSGTVNIQVTANGCNGPSSQVIRTVTINALPTTSAITGNTTPACNGAGYTYSVTLTTGSSYAWTVPAGATITAGATGPENNQITVTFGSTNGDVTVTETNAASCVGSTRTLTISLAGCGLNADFTGTPLTICQGSTVTFTNISTGTTGTTTYSWDFGAGATPATANTVGPHVVTYSTSGSKTVSLTITDGSSDTETKTDYITVTPTVGTPTAITISAGTEPTCQLTNGTTTTTYATTATNNTGFNWSLSNGSAGSIGATTGVMTWANGFSGTVNIQVTANGCNGPSAQVIRTVTVTPTVGTPTAITVSAGTEPTCQLTNGTTTTTYATTATNNTGFNWSLSNGSAGSIGATTGIMTWANGFSGTVNIQVTANGCNGPSAQVIRTVTVTPTVGTPTAITVSAGTEPTCQLTNGTTTTTYATTATNNTGFNWSLSNGLAGSIGATTGIMTWANGFSGTVNIQVTANGCNGPSAQVIRTVTITPTVGTPTAITVSAGTEPTCQLTNGTTTTTYATTATNNTGFNWSLSNGSAGNIGATTGIMTWANGFSGTVNIQVTANGCNGPSSQVIRTVTITPTVGTPTAITVSAGTEPTCQLTNGTTTTTYATTATNNTGFNWSLSNGSAGNIGTASGIMTWANGFSGTVNIQVTANGCNGPSSQVIRTVTITPTVGTPTAITVSAGTEPTCQLTNGTTTTTYATTATNNTGFNWSLSNGSAGSIGATTGIMTWANGFSGTVNIQVTANGCNGPSAQVIRTVTIIPTVGAAGSITGVSSVCQGTNGITYSVAAILNATSYTWVYSGTGITIVGTTNSITINFSVTATSGNLTVAGTNNCGNGTSSPNFPITVNPILPVSVSIVASANPVCAGTSVTFTATPTNGGTTPVYQWFKNSISVATGVTYTYVPVNGDAIYVVLTSNAAPCAFGSPATSDTIFANVVEGVIADAGPDQQLCELYTTTLTGNNPPVGSVGNWTFVSGPSVVNPSPSNSPAATVINLIPSTIPYIFRYTITSTYPGISCSNFDDVQILNYNFPSYSYAGPDQVICLSGGTATSTSTTLTGNTPVYGTGTWVQNSGPSTAVIANPTSPSTVVSNLVPGSYIFLWIIGNGVCNPSQSAVNITVNTPAIAFAGPDATICNNSNYTLSGSAATNYTSLIWTTSGSGYFNDYSLLHPTYTPSPADIAAGNVRLILHLVSASPCVDARDTMLLTINSQAIANAGPDATICETSTYTISGSSAQYYTSLNWTSTGTGLFTTPGILHPVYTPSAADIASGSVKLILHLTSSAPCVNVTDTMVLNINRQAIANAGLDATICETSTYLLSGSSASYYSFLEWVTTGTGYFNNDQILHPTYTPSPADIAAGSVRLILHLVSIPPCVDARDTMILSINRQAIANAGPDATICETSTYTISGSSAQYYTSLNWTSTGTGLFTTPGILHPVYTPSAADIASGSVKLILHLTSSPPCVNVTDTMVLSINRQAIAYAGPNATICESSTYPLNGSTTQYYSYQLDNLWYRNFQ